jgi:hypothetical protein
MKYSKATIIIVININTLGVTNLSNKVYINNPAVIEKIADKNDFPNNS